MLGDQKMELVDPYLDGIIEGCAWIDDPNVTWIGSVYGNNIKQ